MKKLLLTVTLIAVFAGAYAQETTNYWVVETNAKVSARSIIRIYDADNNLVTESSVDRVIDIRNKKEKKMLNRMARQNGTSAQAVAFSKKKNKPVIAE